MRSNFLLVILSLVVISFFSCEKSSNRLVGNNCEYPQNQDFTNGIIDDIESDIMQDCREDAYQTKSDIESNLIGEWQLVGYGRGWNISSSGLCAYFHIEEDMLTYHYTNDVKDIVITSSWEIIKGENNFFLETDDIDSQIPSLTSFCPKYMYMNSVPADGIMFLYEKL